MGACCCWIGNGAAARNIFAPRRPLTSAKLPGGEYGGIATVMRYGELFVWSDFGHQIKSSTNFCICLFLLHRRRQPGDGAEGRIAVLSVQDH